MKLLLCKIIFPAVLFQSSLCGFDSTKNGNGSKGEEGIPSFKNEYNLENDVELGPNITSLTALSSCSLKVQWDTTGFEGDTTYYVNWNKEGTTSAPKNSGELEGTTHEYDITGLNSSTTYVVWVSANITGNVVDGKNDTQITEGTTAIANLTTTEVTSTRIDLKWAMEKGDCPLEFSVEWDGDVLWDPGRLSHQEDSTSDLKYSMLNLIPYTDYGITVRGFDAAGTPGMNQTIQAQTPEGKASSPEDISSVVLTSSSVNLTWSEPAAKNGVLAGYVVKGRIVSQGIVVSPKETNDTFAFIENLLPCGNYTFSVQALTNGGRISGDPGAVNSQTDAEVPPPVTELKTESINSKFVNISWAPPDTLCPITKYCLNGTGDILWSDTTNLVNVTIPGDVTVFLVEDLIPMTNYSLSLSAFTEAGEGGEDSIIFETLEDVPSAPRNLRREIVSSSEVSLSWDPPKDLNGMLLGYLVTWQFNESSTQFGDTTEETYQIGGLDPCGVYHIQVQGVNAPGPGDPADIDVELPSEVPPSPTDMSCEVTGSREIKVRWGRPSTTCQILKYDLAATGVIIWSNSNTSTTGTTTSLEYTLEDLVPYTGYVIKLSATTNAGAGNLTKCTGTTLEDVPGQPQDLRLDEDSVSSHSFIVNWMAPEDLNGKMLDFIVLWGTQRATVLYNEDLSHVYTLEIQADSNKNYNVTVQGETKEGPGAPAFVIVRTEGSSLGLVLGLVIPIILIGIAVGFGYVYREDLTKRMNKIRTAYPTSDYENISELSTAPIPLNQLKSHLLKLRSGNALHGEYNAIAAASYKGSTREAEKAENHSKNRYANILPYDETIVKLRTGSSKYINANYIDSFSQSKFFIATQGPLDNTLEDFWNMIWQENVDIVVMLASCIEAGKIKSSQYWPIPLGYGTELGDYLIQNINEEATQLFSLRMLEVTNRKENTKRLVKQYQYVGWPDFGAPEKDDEIIKLLFSIKKNIKSNREENKMIVHCSAGVGRTGTFIALWNLIEEVESGSGAVCIVREVLNLRRQRVMMVQSQDQYLYIFRSMVAFCENRQRWQLKPDQFSPDSSVSNPSETLYGDGSAATYDNRGFETSFEFEGNLI